ncbi:MAG: hypothetical protein AAAC50_25590 [Rhizobium altiplani]|jgi:TPR repeat protein|uniref:hypothetical protein n=1 Tax=Rhizobium altiplani TaxID=1864509 RepID=UPI000DDA23C2
MRIHTLLLAFSFAVGIGSNVTPAAAVTKNAEATKSKADAKRYRQGFNQGITRTDQLEGPELQSIRRRMIARQRVSYKELQMLADRGDGVAALYVAKRLAANPTLKADAVHYYTIACSTGRAGAVAPLSRLLSTETGSISDPRLDQAEQTLRDHAARGNPVAVAQLIKFYKSGHPFGAKPDEVIRLERQAASSGDAKTALDMAISMISQGLTSEQEKKEARQFLITAQTSAEPSTRAVAAAVLRRLDTEPTNLVEVSQ